MLLIKRITIKLLHLLLLTTVFLLSNSLFAQPALPQREITVLPTQPIDFGVFYVTSAGTITVDWQGNVSTTGGVFSLDISSVTPAIFEITLCQGRTVTIGYDHSVLLNGSIIGQLELIIGPAKREGIGTELTDGDTFPVDTNCDFITLLRVGGTLNVPADASHGIYIGSFPMTFTQQ